MSNNNPFATNQQLEVSGLTLDFSEDNLSVFGNLDITVDKVGLSNVEELLNVLEDVKHFLVFQKLNGLLPDKIEILEPTIKMNPFSQ